MFSKTDVVIMVTSKGVGLNHVTTMFPLHKLLTNARIYDTER